MFPGVCGFVQRWQLVAVLMGGWVAVEVGSLLEATLIVGSLTWQKLGMCGLSCQAVGILLAPVLLVCVGLYS